jgi:23S rRNA pseudouridine2605 synthase
MNNCANYQPDKNSDDFNGTRGERRPRRTRILNSEGEQKRTSFNPNFYKENRTYKPSTRTEGGQYDTRLQQQRKPYNSDRPHRTPNSYGTSYYNREKNGDRRSYNSENKESYSENRRYNNGYESENRGVNQNNGSYSPYNKRNSGYTHQHSNFQRNDNEQGRGFKPRFQRNNDNYHNPNNKYSQKKQIEYKKQFVDYTLPMRLNKFIANSNICSRREADEFIRAGVISVNGNIVTELGTKIIPANDKVMFHDRPVSMQKKVYILLNKPKNCVTTTDDPQERQTVMDFVREACVEKVYPVGRLDRNTTGVLLITNDGDLTSKLTHPKYDKKKIYQIKLDREFEQADVEALCNGIVLEDGDIKADEISFPNEDDRRIVGVEIHSGKNRIIRRMFEHLKYRIVSLDRVFFAGLTKQKLPRGKWRFLSEKEVSFLKMNN